MLEIEELIRTNKDAKEIKDMKNGIDFFMHHYQKRHKAQVILCEDSYLKCDKKEIPVDSLIEVRPGHLTSKFLSNSSNNTNENNCLSMIYKDVDHNTGNYELKSIDMEFESKEVRNQCLQSIEYLIKLNSEVMGDIGEISRVWKKFDKKELSEREIKKLFEMLNFDISSKQLSEYFKRFDTNNDKTLQIDEFFRMIMEVRERKILESLHDNKINDASSLQKFLRETQKDEFSLEECKRLVSKYKTGKNFDKFGFEQFMLSEDNNVLDPNLSKIHHDLDQPLTHYFIDSSHNTYLSGHQLKGESSIEMYSSALRRGCRCVELDVWDGDNKEPMIKHGYTLTSKINLRDVCKIIAKHAFVTNPYPVILSIENHTSKEQQDVMAQIFKETLGNLLASPSMLNDRTDLPSPNELKNKILLKGTMFSTNITDPEKIKKLQEKNERIEKGEKVEESESSEDEEEGSSESGEEKEEKEVEVKDKKEGLLSTSTSKLKNFFSKKKEKKEEKKEEKKNKKVQKKLEKISEELAKLIFLKSVSFKGFEAVAKNKCYEMCSFAESIIDKGQIIEHKKYNERCLSRIYPKGTRFDSSNYDPIPHWDCNSQIVALNYQTSSIPMKLNRGKFRENGRTGYLLQTKYLSNHKPFPYKKLKISQISGRQFPRSGETSDPYVTISLHGDAKDQKFETSVIDNNGFNPSWENEDAFVFDLERVPSSILLFEVRDKDLYSYKNMAHFAIPVHCIRPGYRILYLEDAWDNKIYKGGANLFCYFEFL